jgi:hypothetical protein
MFATLGDDISTEVTTVPTAGVSVQEAGNIAVGNAKRILIGAGVVFALIYWFLIKE